MSGFFIPTIYLFFRLSASTIETAMKSLLPKFPVQVFYHCFRHRRSRSGVLTTDHVSITNNEFAPIFLPAFVIGAAFSQPGSQQPGRITGSAKFNFLFIAK